MAPLTSHHLLPPFPDDVETAPLVSISFAKLEAVDEEASKALFEASKELGFFYLDLFGSELGEQILSEAEKLNEFQREFFNLPNEVKDVYGRPHLHPFYAYRYSEVDGEDENGAPLRSENYNLRKDDILGQRPRLDCHASVLAHNDLFASYARHCHAATTLLLRHLTTHLQLPPNTLTSLHRLHALSGDHIRLIRAPGQQSFCASRASRAAHTDFGTLTLLINWLGGLQIRHPTTQAWLYVRPVPGAAVVNLGDAMVRFTAGLLRSNVHRVIPAPGAQNDLSRTALVYFLRPEDGVRMSRVRGGLVDERPVLKLPGEEEDVTAEEWILAKGTGKLPGVYTAGGFEWGGRVKPSEAPVAVPTVGVAGAA